MESFILITHNLLISIIEVFINIYMRVCLYALFNGGTEAGHCDDALVAMVATQCCWKLGDMAELQPSLWHWLFSPSSPSSIHALLLVSESQHCCRETSFCSCKAGQGDGLEVAGANGEVVWSLEVWPCRMLVMWFRRSLKNAGTPS